MNTEKTNNLYCSILVVDDDTQFRQELTNLLRRRFINVKVQSARSPREAINKFSQKPFDMVLLDMNFGYEKMSGLEILEEMRKGDNPFYTIALTGYAADFGFHAGKIGIDVLIQKSKDFEPLLSVINKQIKNIENNQTIKISNLTNKISNNKKAEVIRLLFLASNPFSTSQLMLDEEIRSIDQVLRQAEYRDRFDIRQHWAVRITDLPNLLLRYKPEIVHFSGHGNNFGEIILKDQNQEIKPVSIHALSKLFSILKDNIRCVVLNACYSEAQAKVIAEHVDFVIGMSRAISDTAAICFAGAFYQAIGYGRDLNTAFELGCLQIDLESLDEQNTPKLLSSDIDPNNFIFV